MMRTSIVKFSNEIHLSNMSATYVQCRVTDLLSKKTFWLSFTRGSRLYKRVYNLKFNDSSGFTEIIKWNETSKDKVVIVKDEKLTREYPQYLI